MTIQKSGDWARARKMLSSTPLKMQKAVEMALRQEAHLLQKEIVQGITKQSPGGNEFRPLSPLTLAARELKGRGGTKALMVRGDLRNSISVVVRGDEAFVGVLRKARGKDGQALVDVAEIQEFGFGPIIIPITPKMRRFLFVLFKKAGIEPKGGSGKGVIVVNIPARPFMRPVFEMLRKDSAKRFKKRVAQILGWRS